jgi:hypothetical protein
MVPCSEQLPSMCFVYLAHEEIHRPKVFEREPCVFLSDSPLKALGDACRLQECLNLLRLNLAARDEHAPSMLVRETPESCFRIVL